jgi:colicin import membrane protein
VTATIYNSGPKEERWVWMMALSFLFHFAIFSTILFIPQNTIRFPSVGGKVYQVELVGSPPRLGGGVKAGGRASIAKRKETSQKILRAKTRRITPRKGKTAPVLAKRVSPKPIAKPRKKAHSASELIDKAISKIQRKGEKEETTQPERILDKPEGDIKDLSGREGGGIFRVSPGTGKIVQIYQMEIENTIKNNWSYPVTLLNLKKDKIPEAVMILIVRSDGKILKARFKKRSNNRLFDDSVLKAIERSDPLPKFPPGYRKTHDEVEINFSLKDIV